jgi:hypothetical protein
MGGSSVNGSRAPNIVVILDQDVVEIDRRLTAPRMSPDATKLTVI